MTEWHKTPAELVRVRHPAAAAATTLLHWVKSTPLCVARDFGAIPNEPAAAIANAAAFNQALAIGGMISVPPGDWHLGAALNILVSRTTLSGCGPAATRLIFRGAAAAGDFVRIGVTGGARVENIDIERLLIAPADPQTAGYAINVRNAQNLGFDKVSIIACRGGWRLGDPAVSDDVVNIQIERPYCSGGTSGVPWVLMESGAILEVRGGKWNGAAPDSGSAGLAPLFALTNQANRWDGIVIDGITAEQWASHVWITGHGVANLRFSNSIIDRCDQVSMLFQPSYSGAVNHVQIIGNTFQGRAPNNASSAVVASEANNGAVFGVTMASNNLFDFGGNVVSVADDVKSVTISGNNIFNCGYHGWNGVAGSGTGRALINIGAATVIAVTGNTGTTGPSGSPGSGKPGYRCGIEWQGAGTVRSSAANSWNNADLAPEVGAP